MKSFSSVTINSLIDPILREKENPISHMKINIYFTAYLVLCGRAIGPHFGRNQTIILEGHIDNLEIASKYTIRSKLYQIVEKNLKIDVPYRNAADYDIWMTDERPSHPCETKFKN